VGVTDVEVGVGVGLQRPILVIVIKLEVVVGVVGEHIVIDPYPLITPSTINPVSHERYVNVWVLI
jgi:hypothetical protein